MLSGCWWGTRFFVSSNTVFILSPFTLYLYLMKWTSIGRDIFPFDRRMLTFEKNESFFVCKNLFLLWTDGSQSFERISKSKITISVQTINIYFHCKIIFLSDIVVNNGFSEMLQEILNGILEFIIQFFTSLFFSF